MQNADRATWSRFQPFKMTSKCPRGSVAGDPFQWNNNHLRGSFDAVKFPPSIPDKIGLSLNSLFMRFSLDLNQHLSLCWLNVFYFLSLTFHMKQQTAVAKV